MEGEYSFAQRPEEAKRAKDCLLVLSFFNLFAGLRSFARNKASYLFSGCLR